MKNVDEMERQLIKTKRKIERLKAAESLLNKLLPDAAPEQAIFKSEVSSIKSNLKNIARVDEVEREVAELREKLSDYKGVSEQLGRAISKIEEIKGLAISPLVECEELIEKAKASLAEGDLLNARHYASQAEKLVVAAVTKAKAEKAQMATVREMIDSARSALKVARGVGCNVTRAERLLSDASSSFSKRDYAPAIEYAKGAKQAIEKLQLATAREMIDSARSALKVAKGVGCNVTRAERLLSDASSSFSKGDYAPAIEYAKGTKQAIEELQLATAKETINSVKAAMEDANQAGCKVAEAEGLFEKAASVFDAGNYTEAIEYARKAEERVKVRRENHRLAHESLTQVTTLVQNAGIQLPTTAAELLEKSRTAFSDGEYERATELAKEAERIVEKVKLNHAEGRELIESASSALESSRAFGCDVAEAEGSLREARTRFEIGGYTEAIKYARQAKERAVALKKESKPEIAVSFSRTDFEPNTWEDLDLTVRNIGTAHAEAMELSFPRRMEVDHLKDIPKLGRGDETRLTVRIKPVERGKVPVTLSISFRDREGNKYTGQQTVDFNVEARVEWKEKQPVKKEKPLTDFPTELAETYAEVEQIGKGGFARVFKARRRDGKKVAVKVPLSLDEATGKSFIKEIQNWTRFDHPNIVKVQDYNIMPVPFFELELCDSSLDDMKKPLEPEKAAWLIFNICEGLKYAHSQGVIHRDLKPQNILLKDGMPKISDWGLSKVMAESSSRSALASFTLTYAAPEQISGGKKDESTDIWQIGVILYELVTGKIPFKGENISEIAMAIVTSQPVSPSSLNPEAESLEPVITRCLKKDRTERYESAGELQRELAQYLGIKYQESLKLSKSRGDSRRSAYYCSELLIVNMRIKDLVGAYKFASEMARYAEGEAKPLVEEFCKQLEDRINYGMEEPPEELVKKAEVICHKIRVQFRR